MKKMVCMWAVAAVGLAVVTGCAFNPESMPVMDRDSAVYVDQDAPKTLNQAEKRAKVAVVVSPGGYPAYAQVCDAMNSTLSADLSKFAFFEVVDRSSAAALLKEQLATTDDPFATGGLKQVEADFLVVVRLTSLSLSQGNTRLDAQFDFKWISQASQKVIMTKAVAKNSAFGANLATQDAVIQELNRMAGAASEEFAQAITIKYMPPARVLQTRGNCEAARISLGSNYGLRVGYNVRFYEFVDNSALGGKKRDFNDIGRGVVKQVERDSAWVQVADHEKVHVRKGVYVRVLEGKSTGILGDVDIGL